MLFLLTTMNRNAADDFTFTFTSATFINKSVEFLSRNFVNIVHLYVFFFSSINVEVGIFLFIGMRIGREKWCLQRKTEGGR